MGNRNEINNSRDPRRERFGGYGKQLGAMGVVVVAAATDSLGISLAAAAIVAGVDAGDTSY